MEPIGIFSVLSEEHKYNDIVKMLKQNIKVVLNIKES